MAAALHADDRNDDAERVLVGILRPFPNEHRAIELLAAVAVARGVAPKPAARSGTDDTPRAPSAGAEASADGVPVPDPPRPRFRIRQDTPRVPPSSPPREPPRESSAAAAAAARDVLAGAARRPSPPRWSRHERILLADRLPPPKPLPRPAAPPPPVTKAELDAELAAKRERLRRERDADVAAARLAAAMALEEEAAEKSGGEGVPVGDGVCAPRRTSRETEGRRREVSRGVLVYARRGRRRAALGATLRRWGTLQGRRGIPRGRGRLLSVGRGSRAARETVRASRESAPAVRGEDGGRR